MSPIDLCNIGHILRGLTIVWYAFLRCVFYLLFERLSAIQRDFCAVIGSVQANAMQFFVAFRLQWIVICRNVNDFEAAGIRGIFCFCFCVCVHIWRFCSQPSVTSNAVKCFYCKNADTFPWISGLLQRNWCFWIKFTRCLQRESIHRTHKHTNKKIDASRLVENGLLV